MADHDLLKQLAACETAVWEALVTGDRSADARLLHDDFLGVYTDGFSGKNDHVGQLDEGPTVVTYTLTDMRVMTMGTTHALLSYRADFIRQDATGPETMYVSSIWQRVDSGWVNIFSQDTPATC